MYIEKDFNGFTRPYFNLHEKLDLLEGIVNKAKSIDVNAALPLYIDDFTDFENYKVKFQDQCLDVFLYITRDLYYTALFGEYMKHIINSKFKVVYACVESFVGNISYIFHNNTYLTEIDIISKNVSDATSILSGCDNLKEVRGEITSIDNEIESYNLFEYSFNNVENPNLINFIYNTKKIFNIFYYSGISDLSFFKNW